MLGQNAGIDVIAAAGRIADHQINRLALVELLGGRLGLRHRGTAEREGRHCEGSSLPSLHALCPVAGPP